MAEDEQVGAGVKAFVALFLAVFVGCGLFQVEAWPFSGWALFSHLRTDELSGWSVTGVDGDGERPIPFSSFPAASRGHQAILDGFEDMTADGRLDVCRAWAAASARTGHPVVEIRIYAVTRSTRDSDSRQRDLRYVCPVP